MQPDSRTQSVNDNVQADDVPPLLSASAGLVIGAPPPLATGLPLPPERARQPWPMKHVFAILLSLCLGLFLADAIVSLADDSLFLLFDIHFLTAVRGIVFLFAVLMAIVIYGLMAITPMIPKRLFLPVTLFNPVAALAVIPCSIFCYSRLPQVSWAVSLCQVIFGLIILFCIQGGLNFHWPLVPRKRLGIRRFSWLNLSAFLLLNVFVMLPAAVAYLGVCAVLAVDHFSEGFLALRPGGVTVRVSDYLRNDGKRIQLVPMAHVGEADFYRKLSQSFPTNSVVLMEGVTDNSNLLTNKITYKRMANSLGLAEQHEEFKPVRAKLVMADVDVERFTTNTIGFLNLVMLIHAKGLNAETVPTLLQFSAPPHFEEQLMDDLLRKRNQHLLEMMWVRLLESDQIIVPWGVAHMPGIAEGIKGAGFRLGESREYTVIRFRSRSSEHPQPSGR
jgi:hypothetical protein